MKGVVPSLFGRLTGAFRPRRDPKVRTPAAPPGRVVYAVGDVHGRDDLLEALLDLIAEDAARSSEPAQLVFLGDYVDRGTGSRAVLERLAALKRTAPDTVLLMGNHEEALLQFLDAAEKGKAWMRFGGDATLRSYGVEAPDGRLEALEAARDEFIRALPPAHLDLLSSLERWRVLGGYLFAHAGVRPGRALAEQDPHDFLWIRPEAMEEDTGLEEMLVHGHTPAEEPEERPWRIGIDTGAYATGVLTALRLEGRDRRYLRTGRDR